VDHTRFKDRVGVVTGAASGIGLAVARRLAAEGARVMAFDRDPAGVDRLADRPSIRFATLDVTDAAGWTLRAAEVAEQFGSPDILVSAAGIVASGRDTDVARADLDAARRVMAVNFEGAWLAIQALLPRMAADGAIVTIASRAAGVGSPSAPAYAASKAALVSLTRSTALHGARDPRRIRCNAVLPGSVDTPMWRPLDDAAARDRAGAMAHAATAIPLGRLADASEIAVAALFLASPEASYITGATLAVDGGQCAL